MWWWFYNIFSNFCRKNLQKLFFTKICFQGDFTQVSKIHQWAIQSILKHISIEILTIHLTDARKPLNFVEKSLKTTKNARWSKFSKWCYSLSTKRIFENSIGKFCSKKIFFFKDVFLVFFKFFLKNVFFGVFFRNFFKQQKCINFVILTFLKQIPAEILTHSTSNGCHRTPRVKFQINKKLCVQQHGFGIFYFVLFD